MFITSKLKRVSHTAAQLAAGLLLLCAGCGGGGGPVNLLPPPPGKAEAQAQVLAAIEGIIAALNEGDVEGAKQFCSAHSRVGINLLRAFGLWSEPPKPMPFGDCWSALLASYESLAITYELQQGNYGGDVTDVFYNGEVCTGYIILHCSGTLVDPPGKPSEFDIEGPFSFQFEGGKYLLFAFGTNPHGEGYGGNY
jgi:hypothetical protein